MKIKIDKNVPVPPKAGGRNGPGYGPGKWQRVYAKMEAGDSVGGLTEHQARALWFAIREAGGRSVRRMESDGPRRKYRVWLMRKGGEV